MAGRCEHRALGLTGGAAEGACEAQGPCWEGRGVDGARRRKKAIGIGGVVVVCGPLYRGRHGAVLRTGTRGLGPSRPERERAAGSVPSGGTRASGHESAGLTGPGDRLRSEKRPAA